MSDEVRNVLEQLLPNLDDEHGDWGDVLTRSGASRVATTTARGPSGRFRRSIAVLVAVAVAAAVVLVVTSPWGGGPTILQRASAAITSPSASGVLYYEAESTHYLCACNPNPPPLRTQVWLQEGGSHHAVALVTVVTCPDGRCERVVWQTGGTLGAHRTLTLLRYDPPRNLLHDTPAAPSIGYLAYDPLATVRDALNAGTAHVESRGTLDGQPVITIDVPIHDVLGTPGTATYIVDAKTYRPMRMIIHHVRGLLLPLGLSLPLVPTFDTPSSPFAPIETVIRFTAYKYLPATAHNLALTNIRALHPTAKITTAPYYAPPPPLVARP